jgi:hypothetical protein
MRYVPCCAQVDITRRFLMEHTCVFATTGKRVALCIDGDDDAIAALQAELSALTLLPPPCHRLARGTGADGEEAWFVALRVIGGKGGFGKTLSKKGRNYRFQQTRRDTAAPAVAAHRNLQGQRVEPGGGAAAAAPAAQRQFAQYRRRNDPRAGSGDGDDAAEQTPEERRAAAEADTVARAVEAQRTATKRRLTKAMADAAKIGFKLVLQDVVRAKE